MFELYLNIIYIGILFECNIRILYELHIGILYEFNSEILYEFHSCGKPLFGAKINFRKYLS